MRTTILTTMAVVVLLLSGQSMAQQRTDTTMDQVPGGSAYSGSGGGTKASPGMPSAPGAYGSQGGYDSSPSMGGSTGSGSYGSGSMGSGSMGSGSRGTGAMGGSEGERDTEIMMDQTPGGSAYSGSGGGSKGYKGDAGNMDVRRPGMGGTSGSGGTAPSGSAPPYAGRPMKQFPPMGGSMQGGGMQSGQVQSGYRGMDNMPMQGQQMPMQPYMSGGQQMSSVTGTLQRDGDLFILTSDQGERYTLDFGGTTLALSTDSGDVLSAGQNNADMSSLVGRVVTVSGVVSQSWSPTSSRQQRRHDAGHAMGGSAGQRSGARSGANFATGKILKVTGIQPAM